MTNKIIKQLLHVAFKQMQNDFYNVLHDIDDVDDIDDICVENYIHNAKSIIEMCNDNNYNIKFNYCVYRIIDKKYKYDTYDINFEIYDNDLIYIIDENNVLLFVVNDYFDIYVNEKLFKNDYNEILNVKFNTNIYNYECLNNIIEKYDFESIE